MEDEIEAEIEAEIAAKEAEQEAAAPPESEASAEDTDKHRPAVLPHKRDSLARSTSASDLDASSARGEIEIFLQSPRFDRIMGLVISINFVVVIVETDHNAKSLDSPIWVEYTGFTLLAVFVIELMLKIFVLRARFHHDIWNVFDFLVIAVDVTMTCLELMGLSFLNVSMLRILRLSRLARATKVLRVFPELRLMLAGLGGAMQAIFWGTMLLLVVLLVWAVLAVQFIHPLNAEIADEGGYGAECGRCSRAYESTFQACLTFTQQIVAGDSWGRETVPIIERHPATAVFFMAVFVSVGLAILNLILGVVVNVATEARDGLLKEIADEKLIARLESQNQLLRMCQEMDEDGDGTLSYLEIVNGFDENEEFRGTLQQMDVCRDDLQIVWTILDSNREGTVTSKEFVSQVYKMKNSDTQFMLAYIKYYVTEIKDKLREDLFYIQKRLETDMETIEQDVAVIQSNVSELVHEQQDHEHVELLTSSNRYAHSGPQSQGDVKKFKMPDPAADGEAQELITNEPIQLLSSGNRYSSPYSSKPATANLESAMDATMCNANDINITVENHKFAAADDRTTASTPQTTKVSLDRLVEQGSLGALFESVNKMDFEETTPAPTAQQIDLDETLSKLEGIWQRCITSVEDMRYFHSNVATLLEELIRRVSLLISETVSASVKMSGEGGEHFKEAYRRTNSSQANDQQPSTPGAAPRTGNRGNSRYPDLMVPPRVDPRRPTPNNLSNSQSIGLSGAKGRGLSPIGRCRPHTPLQAEI